MDLDLATQETDLVETQYFFCFSDELFFGKFVFTKTAKYSISLNYISKKKKDIWKIIKVFWRVKVVLSDVLKIFWKKFNSRCNLTPNIAKNSVFCTFRLGHLNNLRWWQFWGWIRIQRTKNLQKSILWSQGLEFRQILSAYVIHKIFFKINIINLLIIIITIVDIYNKIIN